MKGKSVGIRTIGFTLLLVAVAMMMISGCTTSESGNGEGKIHTSICTAATGGSWFLMGGRMAEVINENQDMVQVTALPSGGVKENIYLVRERQAEWGWLHDHAAYWAYEGSNTFEGDPHTELRQVFCLGSTGHRYAIALKSSGLKTIKDLKGKKVAVGDMAAGTEDHAKMILEAHDMSFDDLGAALYYGAGEAAEALADHQIDAAFFTITTPAAAVLDICSSEDIVFLEFDPDALEKLIEKPFYRKYTLTSDVYRGIEPEKGFDCIGGSSIVATHKDVPEDVVYAMVKALFDNLDEYHVVHQGAKALTLETALEYTIFPMHPGAEKYFKEIGALK